MANITKTQTRTLPATANYLYTLISVVVVASWTIFGFLVWVPMLIRMTMVTSALVFYSAITKQNFDVSANLQKATTFYSDGFHHVLATLRGKQTHAAHPGLEISLWQFAVEVIVAICFWIILSGVLMPQFGIELLRGISEATVAAIQLIGILVGLFIAGAILCVFLNN